MAGPVLGLIEPDQLFGDLMLPVVSLSVALVLFEGSMSLRLSDLRQIGRPLVMLSPATRDYVGYAAAVTAFMGVCVWVFSLI